MTMRFRNIYLNAFNFLHKGAKLIRNTNKTKITLQNFRQLKKAGAANAATWSKEEVIQFDSFLNIHIHRINYASINFYECSPWASLTSSQGKPRWNGQRFQSCYLQPHGSWSCPSLWHALSACRKMLLITSKYSWIQWFFPFTKCFSLSRSLSVVSQLNEQFLVSWISPES